MKIAITRLEEKAADDSRICARCGHECYTVSPLKAEVRIERVREFAASVNRGEYDCIFFASALPAGLIAPLLERQPRVIAIGPKTAEILKKYGVDSEVLPSYYSKEFVPYCGDWLKGRKVGLPRADVPDRGLVRAITGAGGEPHEVRVYSLVPTQRVLDLDGADAVIFTSAMSFREAVWTPRPDLIIIAIGEVTAEVMKERGFPPAVVGDGSLTGTFAAINKYQGA